MKGKGQCALIDNDRDFDAALKAKERVVALFVASWCPYCVKFLPIFERNAGGEGLNFLVIKDDQERMGERYSIDVVPTVLFFEKGAVSKRLDGSLGVGLNEKQLTEFIMNCRSHSQSTKEGG